MSRGIKVNRALASVTPRRAQVLAVVTAGALLGLPGGVGEATASKVRYTLTVEYRGEETVSKDTSDGWRYEDTRRVTSYVARSTHSFVVTRTGSGSRSRFRFNARLSGRLVHVGGGVQYFPGGCEPWRFTERHTVSAVAGTVSTLGGSPVPLFVDIDHARPKTNVLQRWASHACPGIVNPPVQIRAKELVNPLLLVTTRRFNLRKRFGSAFTVTHTARETRRGTVPIPVTERRTHRWTLRFIAVRRKTRRVRWQVDVRGRDHWAWGALTGLQAGVDVDWLHRTKLEIQARKITSATGRVSVENVRAFSEPAGVFKVTLPKLRRSWPSYKLPKATKAKRSDRVTLITYDRSLRARSEYLVKWAVGLAGPRALELMRRAAVPDADAFYGTMAERERRDGPVVSSVAVSVPDPGRLVFLLREGRPQTRGTESSSGKQVPCPNPATAPDCFLRRGIEVVTVTKLP